ncbi:hypothetical protein PR002_g3293 [Phytophthora rubi]|uniref:PH domain-containing protein n=1 Tax=Phytophthora rubi TaxID=129364 RepID=A0A6A3NJS8_9STRA|nr:hypothetical protein PR002_g3293 [Phytophthora rubi]
MRGSFGAQSSRSGSRQHAYAPSENSSVQEPSIYPGKMRTAPESATPVDIILGVSAETVHAITVHQHKMMFQSPIGVMKEVVWDHSEKSVHFVLDDGSTSPTFVFPVLTELEAHFTAILALPDLEKPPEQVYIGVLIGQNLPSPIQQRRASLGSSQPSMLPMSKRRELLRREQPVKNAMSRERLGVEYIRSGFLGFTCSISGDLRGLTLEIHHLRVFPSPDCHDRSACLFSYSYEHLESCEVAGTRLELRFRTTHQLAKQPSFLVFQSLEAQYIREAIWYLKNGTYMDASLREMLASPTRTPRSSSSDMPAQIPDSAVSRRASVLMFFTDADSLKQRIDACCRVIGCQNLAEGVDQSGSKPEEASASNVMISINSGEASHMNPSLRTNPSMSRVTTSSLCELHTSCLSSALNEPLLRQMAGASRGKVPLPSKTIQPLAALLQSPHYAKMFKFQGQLLKRQNARTFHLRKAWHPKLAVLFETPVGGFLCYYDKITHCPGMTDSPKERRVIDLSSMLCIRPVSAASPVTRGNSASTCTMHAFDVVTLYRTWTFAASEPDEYEVWLNVLSECVEKQSTIAPDKILRFPVKLAMSGQSSPTEATSLEISSHGVSFCTGHDAEVELSSWYYTDLEKWSVVFQQGYTCCLLKCRSPAPASPGSPRVAASETITQDFLFRTADASTICLVIEFYVGKCMAKLEVLAGQYLEESRARKAKTPLVVDPAASKRSPANPKLELKLVKEHPIENVSLAPIGSPEKLAQIQTADLNVIPEHDESVGSTILPGAEEASTNGETPIQEAAVNDTVVQTNSMGGKMHVPLSLELEPLQELGHSTAAAPSTTGSEAMDDEQFLANDGVVALVGPSTDVCESPVLSCVVVDTMDERVDGLQEEIDSRVGDAPTDLSASVTPVPQEDGEEINEAEGIPEGVQDTDSMSTTDSMSDFFENVDLSDATLFPEESSSNEVKPEHIPVQDEGVDDTSDAPGVPVVLNTQEPSCLVAINECNDIQHEQTAVPNSDVGGEPSSISSDVFMIEFRADVTCIPDNEPTLDSTRPEPDVVSVVPPAPPLLLLEYLPSWPGEPQLEDEELEDDRESECEVSDRSEAFNSCASEVDLQHVEGDDEFEDAIDLDAVELAPSTRDRIAPPTGDRIDTDTDN